MELIPILQTLAIVVAVTWCLVKEVGSPDLVAMSGFAAAVLLGLVDGADISKVFSNPAPLTVGAMFVLSAALYRTGTIDRLAAFFERLAGTEEKRALCVLALLVMPLSACANNTAVVVVFLPVVLAFVRRTGNSPTRFLMPLSFFAILGGTLTLVGTSTNILVAGIAAQEGMRPFGIFEISPLGAILALTGLAYLFVAGRRFLPDRATLSSLLDAEDTREFCGRAVVAEQSTLVGKPVTASTLWKEHSVRIYEVVRHGKTLREPIDAIICQPGDVWICAAPARGIAAMQESAEVTLSHESEEKEEKGAVQLVEAIVGPESAFIGHSIRDQQIRQRFSVLVAAVHRRGANLVEGFAEARLQFGDTLILEGTRASLRRLAEEEGLVLLNDGVERPYRRRRAPLALLAIVSVMVVAALGWLPVHAAALVAALAVVLLGCIDAREAYARIEWPILFLVFGMLGIGLAMENSGTARWIAHGAGQLMAPLGPVATLGVIYLLASVLTEVVTNNAVAILLTPIAMELAADLGVDPRPFVVAVMFGASASFATPVGYQTNTYVFAAGGYRFSDFLRVGVPMNLLLGVVAVLVIPMLWPF